MEGAVLFGLGLETGLGKEGGMGVACELLRGDELQRQIGFDRRKGLVNEFDVHCVSPEGVFRDGGNR